MKTRPDRLWVLPELALLLAQCDAKHNVAFKQLLADLYDVPPYWTSARKTDHEVTCVARPYVALLGASTAAQAKLSYSASSDRYLDVVGTDPSWKGTCRTVDLELADGTHHAVHVRFTK